MPGVLARVFYGRGRFRPRRRAALDAEGVVLLEEDLPATISYSNFRAPGRRFDGKVVAVETALAVTERRVAAYFGRFDHKLIDTEFDSPRWAAAEVRAEDGVVVLHVDFSRHPDPESVTGQVTIRIRSPNARRIADEIVARAGRGG